MVLCEIGNEKYTVRVHSGRMTEEKRKEVIENAAKKFWMDIQSGAAGRDRCVSDGFQR